MAPVNKVLHHLINKKDDEKFKTFYDKFIIVVAILSPFANLPQLIEIWINKNASGVSVVSWSLFVLLSCIWLTYGLLHKEKPIWLTNIFFLIFNSLIVLGILLYG